MDELNEIKKRLGGLRCWNGYIEVSAIENIIAFIEGLIFEKENKDGTGNM